MTNISDITIGSRIEAGVGEDHDTGRVLDIVGRRALVAWDSGVRTLSPIDTLHLI